MQEFYWFKVVKTKKSLLERPTIMSGHLVTHQQRIP